MDIGPALDLIQSRIRNADQRERIRVLAERVEVAFEKARTKGIKDEIERDWMVLKARFDASLKLVQKATGLYF